jgi:hypothetical protein
VFNRNYDVAMLMFNHPLGQADFLRTGLYRNTTLAQLPVGNTTTIAPSATASNQIDTEALSNAFYLAPSFQYKFRETAQFGGTFVYGRLVQDPLLTQAGVAAGTDKSLGYEVDVNFTFKPYERFTWFSEAGLLIPGKAWQGGSIGYANSVAYGFGTKAAISF